MDMRQKARDAAFRMLSFRAHTCSQIYYKLTHKGFNEEIAADTVAKLCEDGYLNDFSFACNLIEQRLSRKPYGPRYLLALLYRAGIDRHVAAKSVKETVDQDKENELAAKFVRLMSSSADTCPDKIKRKLLIRGFSLEAAHIAVEKTKYDDVSS